MRTLLGFYPLTFLSLCPSAARPVLPKQDKVSKKLRERESLVLECNPPKSSTPPLIHWMDKSKFVRLRVCVCL